MLGFPPDSVKKLVRYPLSFTYVFGIPIDWEVKMVESGTCVSYVGETGTRIYESISG